MFSSSVSSPSSIVFNGVTYDSPTGTGYLRMEVKGTWRDSTVNLVFSMGRTTKVVRACGSTSTSVTAYTSQYCSLYYVPQNYIRYTDRPMGLQSDGTSMDRVAYTRIPNLGTLGSTYDLTSNNVSSAWFDMPALSFVCLDEVEVSMLCVDGSDGKGGVFQLHPVFTMDGAVVDISTVGVRYMTWLSSDPSVATVSSTGLVTAVSNGGAALGKDVTITASYGRLSYSCLFTVYQTMPSAAVEGAGLWLCKGGKGTSTTGATDQSTLAAFTVPAALPSTVTGARVIHSFNTTSYFVLCGWWQRVGVLGTYLPVPFQTSTKRAAVRHAVSNPKVWGTTYNDYFIGGVFSGGFQDLSSVAGSAMLNGSTYPLPAGASSTNTSTGPTPTTSYTEFRTLAQHTKSVLFSISTRSSVTHAGLLDRALSDALYVHQNYVRYTDRTTLEGTIRANYTLIPNIGSAGKTYDLSANKVPSSWYGV